MNLSYQRFETQRDQHQSKKGTYQNQLQNQAPQNLPQSQKQQQQQQQQQPAPITLGQRFADNPGLSTLKAHTSVPNGPNSGVSSQSLPFLTSQPPPISLNVFNPNVNTLGDDLSNNNINNISGGHTMNSVHASSNNSNIGLGNANGNGSQNGNRSNPQNNAKNQNSPPENTSNDNNNNSTLLPQPSSTVPANTTLNAFDEEDEICKLVFDLTIHSSREVALLELSKKRESHPSLAPILWHSFGTMSCLLQELIAVYPLLQPPTLTGHASNRVCNALALLQCVASHSETRGLFLNAHIPLFLYPFLNTTSRTRPFEYLRLTSLGVIGALVKQNDNSEVINFLLSTEIIPLCLRIMETGSELSKTVAIFIVQKILLDDTGLSYICQTYERFYAVGTVLSNMVQALVSTPSIRLVKHVVRCYLRLSDNGRAREALRRCLPEELRNETFSEYLRDDLTTKKVSLNEKKKD